MHSSDGMKAPLLSSHDVPPHVRQPFISLGYRRPLRHPYRLGAAAAAGLFSWHNETLNVWSHLLGLLWALSRLAETLAADGVAPVAKAAVGAFDVSAVAVLAASATAHLCAMFSSTRLRLDSSLLQHVLVRSLLTPPGLKVNTGHVRRQHFRASYPARW